MPDKYSHFVELARREAVDVDYRVCTRYGGPTLVLAPHAGGIEPGTSELAQAIAAGDHSLYLFEGLKRADNGDLHITSTHFDEPECLKALRRSDTVLSLHGEGSETAVVYVGGRDKGRRNRIATELRAAGFDVRDDDRPHLAGEAAANICNRGRSGLGVQLEITPRLRRSRPPKTRAIVLPSRIASVLNATPWPFIKFFEPRRKCRGLCWSLTHKSSSECLASEVGCDRPSSPGTRRRA
jgi:phage replication-related protein YjqB (UPF0714/DUF867 family)